MEPLFKNSYVRDREMVKELYRHISFKRKSVILFTVLLTIYLILTLIECLFFDADYNFLLFYIFLSAVFYAIQVLLYRTNVKTTIKRDLEVFKEAPTIITTVTNDNITHCIQGNTEYILEFSSIKKASQTKNYILLQTRAKLIYAFKKDGFILGNKEELAAFLGTKGISVKNW